MSDPNQKPSAGQNLSNAKRKLLEQRLRGRSGKVNKQQAPLLPRPNDAPRLASLEQERIFFLHQLNPHSPSYNITSSFWTDIPLDVARLKQSVTLVFKRHECLHSSYHSEDSNIIQRTHEDCSHTIHIIDVDKEVDLMTEAEQLARTTFDPDTAPMCGVFYLRPTQGPHLLSLVFHHLVFDEWSLGILWKEFAATYNALGRNESPPLPALDAQYADYAHWQRHWLANGHRDQQLRYWKKQLAHPPLPLELPKDFPPPAQPTDNGDLAKRTLPAHLAKSLRSLAAEEDASMFMLMMLGFFLVLERYTASDDIIVGTPVANRRLRETASLIGFFLSTVAIRPRLTPTLTAREALAQIRKTTLSALENRDTPLNDVIDAVQPKRTPGIHPLFQVMFVHQKSEEAAPHVILDGRTLLPTYVSTQTSKFDLTLFTTEGDDGIETVVEYRTDLFKSTSIDAFLEHYENLLTAIADHPDTPISSLPMLSPSEEQRIETAARGPVTPLQNTPLVPNQILASLNNSPENPVLITRDSQVSASQLHAWSHRITQQLVEKEVAPGHIVALYLDRSPAAIAAILATHNAGAAYLPIDPAYPEDRCRFMLKDANAAITITTPSLSQSPVLEEVPLLIIPDSPPEAKRPASLPSLTEPQPDDAAYLIYTSGSTGQPKGVLVSHDNLRHSTAARMAFYPDPPGRFLLIPSLSFDSSVAGIFWTLAGDGSLVLPNPDEQRDPAALAQLIAARKVTSLLCIPTLYRELLNTLEEEKDSLSSLKTVIVAGEACPPQLVADHFRHLPEARLFNEYGPTEATVWATAHECSPKDARRHTIPIGQPIQNAQAWLLDQHQRLTPDGVPGEIYLDGNGIAAGYLNQPERTKESFPLIERKPNHPQRFYRTGDLAVRRNNKLEFLGRTDDQVKIRGYRIESGEIENALCLHPAVTEAVVVAASPAGQEQSHHQLHAFFTASTPSPEPADLRKKLAGVLPQHMIPAHFVSLDSFPRLPNGKIDRPKLAQRAAQSQPLSPHSQLAPDATLEASLLHIWQTILGNSDIQPDTDFFEAGGDSILAIQIVAAARREGIRFSLAEFIAHPTVAALAGVANEVTKTTSTLPPTPAPGPVPLTPIQLWFFQNNHPRPNHWNLPLSFEIPADIPAEHITKALQALIKNHDALRLTFSQKDSGWSATLNKKIPRPSLVEHDFSHLSREECHKAIEEQATMLHRSLDLSEGLLLKAARFQRPAKQPDLLILTIHHLATDVVSLRLITDDLESALQQQSQGQSPTLEPPSASWQAWTTVQKEFARTPELAADAAFWEAQSNHQPDPLPRDLHSNEPDLETDGAVVSASLPPEETKSLIENRLPTLHAERHELLLCALSLTLRDWTGYERLCIGLEGHGREPLTKPDLDLSQTVGWFTSTFPLTLELPKTPDFASHLVSVKDSLRAIPHKGATYGILRELTQNPHLKNQPAPELLFNYIGRTAAPPSAAPRPFLTPVSPAPGQTRCPRSPRPALIEINAGLYDDTLVFRWNYNVKAHTPDTIQHLAVKTIEHLTSLSKADPPASATVFTPSDFPEADLDSDDLEKIMKRFR